MQRMCVFRIFARALGLLLLVGLLFPEFAFAQALSSATINDPTLGGMKAFTVSIPSGWKFEGTVVRGPDCQPISSPVFRTYSRDGLSEIRMLPAFSWSFHPAIKMGTVAGCLPIQRTLTAVEFLDHFVELIPGGVHVVGPMATGASYDERVKRMAANQNASNRIPGTKITFDAAAMRVETMNGTFLIEQRLRAWVDCRTNQNLGRMSGGGCSAHVDVVRAPKGKLDQLVGLVDEHDLTKTVHDPQWLQTYMTRQNREGADRLANLTAIEKQQQGMLRKQYEQVQETMNRNHAAFMAQQESSFRSSMNNANRAMNARTTAASDWVDYALDQQTVTGAGGTVKISNAYGHTWSNGQNEWFQTNDPNANPNGVLKGNWSEDTKVHGNGQSY